jgi:putative NIF3 family GTP cyclohydrolase 1 type 2
MRVHQSVLSFAAMDITRRTFLAAGATVPFASVTPARHPRHSFQAPATSLTGGQIVDRIKTSIGVPWREQTVDRIVAGSADTIVEGVATTMMATLEVLQRAAAAKRNFIVTHESTFFSHQDRTDNIAQDPTYLAKLNFIQHHHLAVFHFHDHWHAKRPVDGIAAGMIQELGWEKRQDPQNFRHFTFEWIPLRQLAQEIESKLRIRTMRVVGDPELRVNRALASWGNVSLMPGIPYLSQAGVDVLIVGETHEWELVEYVQDMRASGLKKALIVLGHVVSEQAGMKYCAEWLREFVKEVPVEFITAPEPFWRPGTPVA